MPRPSVPASPDAERSALSAALIDPVYAMPVLLNLTEADFHDPLNRTLFEVMRDAWNETGSIDILSLTERLTNRGAGQNMQAYLVETSVFEPSAIRIQEFVDIVKDRSIRRQLLAGLSTLARQIHDIERPIAQIADTGVDLFRNNLPPLRGGTNASDGARSVLAKAHYYYSNPIGDYETRGIDTGYAGLNVALDGWKRGYAYYLLGMEHSGKTSLAFNFAMKICQNGGTAVLFSLEQSADVSDDPQRSSLWERIVLALAGITYRQYHVGRLTDEESSRLLDAGDRVSHWNLFIFDNVRTIPAMEAAIRQIAHEVGGRVDLVVIDYLKLIEQSERYSSRNEEIGGLTRKIKRMALETDTPIVVPHQVSSKSLANRTNKRIQLSDAYESGHVSQDADVVFGLNRPELWDPATDKKNIIELDILKDRVSGGTGLSVDLYFNKATGLIATVYQEQQDTT